MKVAFLSKTRPDIIEDKELFKKFYIEELNFNLNNKFKKGGKVIYKKIKVGLDGNDFINDLRTVVLEGKWFKKPRFIK